MPGPQNYSFHEQDSPAPLRNARDGAGPDSTSRDLSALALQGRYQELKATLGHIASLRPP